MEMDEVTKMIVNINSQLAALTEKLTGLQTSLNLQLSNYERRLTVLEDNKRTFKDDVVLWLVKGLVAAVLTIGSLTGAGALIKKIFAGG